MRRIIFFLSFFIVAVALQSGYASEWRLTGWSCDPYYCYDEEPFVPAYWYRNAYTAISGSCVDEDPPPWTYPYMSVNAWGGVEAQCVYPTSLYTEASPWTGYDGGVEGLGSVHAYPSYDTLYYMETFHDCGYVLPYLIIPPPVYCGP